MDQFDNNLIPQNINNFNQQWEDHIICFLRLEISEFLLQNINKEFFDFTSFYSRFKITNNDLKKTIMNQMIHELKNLGWHIASIFGDTAIVIHTSEDTLKKSLWATSFDFLIK